MAMGRQISGQLPQHARRPLARPHERPTLHPSSGAAAKRQKLDADAPIIRPTLLSEDSRAALKAQYRASQPYPHVVMAHICNPAKLRQARPRLEPLLLLSAARRARRCLCPS